MRPVSAKSRVRRSPKAMATARNTRKGHSPRRISVSPKVACWDGDHDMAVGHQAGATAQRGALDRGDQGLGQARADGEQLLVNFADGLGGLPAPISLDVHARAEGLAVPREQDGADARIVVGTLQGGDQVAAKFGAERIALFRAVEDYAQHPPVRFDFDEIVHAGSSEGQPGTVRFGRRAEYTPIGTYYRPDYRSEGTSFPAVRDSSVPSLRRANCFRRSRKEKQMLHWSLVFLVIALIAAVLGFGGVAGTAAGIAKVLFVIFLVVWVLAFMVGRRAL